MPTLWTVDYRCGHDYQSGVLLLTADDSIHLAIGELTRLVGEAADELSILRVQRLGPLANEPTPRLFTPAA